MANPTPHSEDQPDGSATPGDTGYDLTESRPLPPRADMAMLERTARWCPACGCDLTMTDQPPCPRCERPFNPDDPSTTSPKPVEPEQENYWRDKQRIAGYIVLPLFLFGRALINVFGQDMTGFITGSGGFAGVAVGVMVTLLIIPWLVATVFFLLIATSDYYNPRTVYCLGFGAIAGIIIVLGLHPVLLLAGVVAGLFAGMVRAWAEKAA